MQRKNYLLNPSQRKQKPAMALIMAIAVIVILSTIMALSLSLTAQTSKKTNDIYLYEQSALYAKSAVELALLDIAKNGCTSNNPFLTTFDGIYDVNITKKYVYTSAVAGCPHYFDIQTDEQNGSVVMDVTITVKEDQNLSTEPIRYFRRTIQKL